MGDVQENDPGITTPATEETVSDEPAGAFAAEGGGSANDDVTLPEGGSEHEVHGDEKEEEVAPKPSRKSYRPSLEVVKVRVKSFYEKGEFNQEMQVIKHAEKCFKKQN